MTMYELVELRVGPDGLDPRQQLTLVEERPQRLKRGIPWESGVSLSVRRKHPDAHRAELVECALRLRVTQEGGEMRRTSKSDLARE